MSLFPAENVREGALNPWPFREDLLDMLKALNPRCVIFSKCLPVYMPCTCIGPLRKEATEGHSAGLKTGGQIIISLNGASLEHR